MPMSNPVLVLQRLRMRYRKESLIKYVSHLDLMRIWERALRRACMPVAYSRGFNPQPKIVSAAALPVGFSSEAEVLDISLVRPLAPLDVLKKLSPQLPEGLSIMSIEEIAITEPSLQSRMRQAEYRIKLRTSSPRHEIGERIQALLSTESIPRQKLRKGRMRSYDLRPLLDDAWVESGWDEGIILGMRLQLSGQSTGRPDDVLEALGYSDDTVSIRRTRLIWNQASPNA